MLQTPEQIALERIHQAAESRAETLDLHNLGLTTLPDELWKLTQLKELLVGDNKLCANKGCQGKRAWGRIVSD
jgi:hypothetical protein